MDASFENEMDLVHCDQVTISNDVPIQSRTASRRTLAKYLKKKVNISKLLSIENNFLDNSRNLIKDDIGSLPLTTMASSDFSIPFSGDGFNHDLPPLIFPPNMPSFLHNYNVKHPNYNDENQENNSSIADMLKCVLENTSGCVDPLEKCVDYPSSWLINHLPFNFCDSNLSCSGLSASIDKQEREIAYNLLVRRIIDDTLDRNVIFSHQPKELLNLINSILVRQFAEYEESKHRSKVRSYLKACRRNSKKNNGKILMKNTAAYLSSGPGNRLMNQIYNSEKETLDFIKKESERLKMAQNVKLSQTTQSDYSTPSSVHVSSVQQKHILHITNNLPPILPASVSSIHSSLKPIAQIYTTQSKVNVAQLPLLMPFNSTIHTESIKKTSLISEYSSSEEIIKSISEIAKNTTGKDNTVNLKDIVTQLKATASFLDNIAKTLEQSVSSSTN